LVAVEILIAHFRELGVQLTHNVSGAITFLHPTGIERASGEANVSTISRLLGSASTAASLSFH
jgi:hypothetical protein